MSKRGTKRYMVRFTEEEWEIISQNAEIEHMSVNSYIINRAIQESNSLVLTAEQQKQIFDAFREENFNPLILNSDRQNKMKRQLNLIAYYIGQRCKKEGMTEDQLKEILDR